MGMTQMKGITCCGDCGYYNWKKHKCTRATDEGDARDKFYADCPLPDVVPVQEPRVMTLEEVEQKKVMWLETNNHEWDAMNGIHETVLRTDDDRYDFSDIIVQFVDQEGCEIICARDRFGIEWRCWTSRPTDEVRRVTPWN